MKMKWYISTLVIVLAFVGIYSHRISSPNQEILIQFNIKEVSIEQSQQAIDVIKQQLIQFGVDDFHIRESENGDIRISYHSSIAVESIKQALSSEQLGLDYTSVGTHQNNNNKSPSKENQRHFNLDVYELQKSSENNSAGKFVIIVKQDYDRYLNSNFYPSFNLADVLETNDFGSSGNQLFCDGAVKINNTSYIFPEVRAGPNISFTS